MTAEDIFWAIGDIHGEYTRELVPLLGVMHGHGFSLDRGHHLVSVGDKNDRGPETFEVLEWFRQEQLKYPELVHTLLGNHELLLLDAADLRDFTIYKEGNGGKATLASYAAQTQRYARKFGLGNMLDQVGHREFLKRHPSFLETEQYFFCHAPIPTERYRFGKTHEQWCVNEDDLTWSLHFDHHTDFTRHKQSKHSSTWVDPHPWGMDKLFISGHIHDLESKTPAAWTSQRMRRYGNAILTDTGAGCGGVLSAIRLPDCTVFNSRGESYHLEV